MDAKTKKLIGSGTAAELSELKARAAAEAAGDPNNTAANEIIAAVNAELERRASAEPSKVRVKAKEFTLVDGRPWDKDREGEITEREYNAYSGKFTKLGLALLLAIVALCFSGVSEAQQYSMTNIGMTNNVPNNSTTTANLASTGNTNIVSTKLGEIGLDISFALNAAGTTACTFKFAKGSDGTNYETTPSVVVSMVPNGTTTVRTNITVTMGAMGYIKPASVVAADNTAAMTNIVVLAVTKPNRLDKK